MSIGYFYGGCLTGNCVKIFNTSDINPNEVYNQEQMNYGKYLRCIYINHKQHSKICNDIRTYFHKYHNIDNLYDICEKTINSYFVNILKIKEFKKLNNDDVLNNNEIKQEETEEDEDEDDEEEDEEDEEDEENE